MKIIFLDIDGVLNTAENFVEGNLPSNPTMEEINLSMLDERLIKNLNTIIEETGAKVVVSSTWRMGRSIEELKCLLDKKGFVGEIIGKTPILNDDRGIEIQKFIDESSFNIDSFTILDDDSDMCHLMDKLIQTNFIEGLNNITVKNAIKMLKEL